ncbi:hypothetical protein CRE_01122 [Caenorhabditis remanei]|uniref:Uncharacterized protein n=1 Tax=Caenorhabditis remanei TaxID=31234 RepID=E3MWJ9_CAERE|nr:hypothetical protein CRE_01122 [Caenorhabditis remanei]
MVPTDEYIHVVGKKTFVHAMIFNKRRVNIHFSTRSPNSSEMWNRCGVEGRSRG